jgi:hypothetical protein
MTHKSADYKISAKFLIVRNLLYKDGYKDIILLKILQEETENQYHIKFLNHK